MKALLYHGPFNITVDHSIPQPQPQSHEALVKVAAVGICGSDIHGYAGKTGRRVPGMIMGHEISGIIESCGPAVRTLKPGQKVVVQPILYCGQCKICRTGRTSICPYKKMIGVDKDQGGGFAEYLVAPEENLIPVPDSVDIALACLAEPFAVAAGVVRAAQIAPEDSVVIVGSGMIGLAILILALEKRPAPIIIIDKNREKLAFAAQLGATTINFLDEDPVAKILSLTQNLGADISIEAVGAAPSVKTAMSVLRNGGRAVWVGNSQKIIELDMQDVVVKAKIIQGVYCYTKQDFQTALNLIAQKPDLIRHFLQKQVSPEQACDLFCKLAKEELELLRAVVLFS